MPRKKEKDMSCCGMEPEMAQKMEKFKGKMWMHGPWMMMGHGCGCCCHKGRGLGAFILAGSVIWMLNIMGIIPPTVPWWLEFVAALGFAATFS